MLFAGDSVIVPISTRIGVVYSVINGEVGDRYAATDVVDSACLPDPVWVVDIQRSTVRIFLSTWSGRRRGCSGCDDRRYGDCAGADHSLSWTRRRKRKSRWRRGRCDGS
jgi:hypothetical protein